MVEYIKNIATSSGTNTIGGKAFDAGFTRNVTTLVSNTSLAASATKKVSLADVIPNDGYDYELTYMVVARTGTTSGNRVDLAVYSGSSTSGIGSCPIFCNTRSASYEDNARTSYLPISHSDRNIYIVNGSYAITNLNVYARGYRRMGTNDSHSNPISNVCTPSSTLTPNALVYGSPTITNGVASNFTASNYIELLNGKQNNNAEYVIKFTTGSTTKATMQDIASAESFFTIEIAKDSWNVVAHNWETSATISLFTAAASTTYWVKIVMNNKTKTYYYSTNGSTYTQVASFTDSKMNPTVVSSLVLGNHCRAHLQSERPFLGSIDLNECYINVNGTRFWNGMDYKKYYPIGGDVFDGQWQNSSVQLLSSVSVASGGHKDVSIASYLNDTSHNYEVYVTGWGPTGSTSGNSCRIKATSGNDYFMYGGLTRTASTRVYGGTARLEVRPDNQTIRIENSGNAAATVTAYVRGKRRMGANYDSNSYLQVVNDHWIGGNNFNGPWVKSYAALATYDSLAATTNYNISLANYLPSDGEAYEILLRVGMWTSSTSGQTSEVYVNGFGQNLMMVRQNTRTNSSHGDSATVIIPVSRGNRTLTIRNGAGSATGSVHVRVYGYRRIGTNT